MTDGGHIFISYKTEQRGLAFLVRDKLVEWGYETWVDVDRLQPGTYWANDIDYALKTYLACVGIMTPLATESRYVTNEWDIAIMKRKLFIPLMFEPTEPHYKYIDIQFVNFTTVDRTIAFKQLQERLNAYDVGSTTTKDPYHDYLQHLYDRINKYLSAKLITSLRDVEGRPDPIELLATQTEGMVDISFDTHEEIDPLVVSKMSQSNIFMNLLMQLNTMMGVSYF